MSVEWELQQDSEGATIQYGGSSDQSTYRRKWIVRNVGTDSGVAHTYFSTQLDGTKGELYGKYGTYYFRFQSYTAEHLGGGHWSVEATYATIGGGSQEAGGSGGGDEGEGEGKEEPIGILKRVTYDSTGGQQHITSALSQSAHPPTAPDLRGAIGVSGDNVNGCDIIVPVFEWQEEYEIPGEKWSLKEIAKIAKLSGTLNTKAFREFEPGEVLFIGLGGGYENPPNVQMGGIEKAPRVQYRFAYKERGAGTIAGIPIIGGWGGWDHIDIRYKDIVDDDVGLKEPVAVYVNTVYKSSDFDKLRLPGG